MSEQAMSAGLLEMAIWPLGLGRMQVDISLHVPAMPDNAIRASCGCGDFRSPVTADGFRH